MATRRPLAEIDGRKQVIPAADSIDGVGEHWAGATVYDNGRVRTWAKRGLTDSSGRFVFNLTEDGLATGKALFSEITSIQGTGIYMGTDATQVPLFHVDSLTADLRTASVRFIRLASVLGIINLSFGAANVGVFAFVIGVRPVS